MYVKFLGSLFKETFMAWLDDKAPRMAAALAFYTLFSIAPLLIIIVAIAGLVFGQEEVRMQIAQQIRGLVGDNGTLAVMDIMQSMSKPAPNIIAALIGLVTLLFGASGVFSELQDALNTIWRAELRPDRGVLDLVKDRFFSFLMILGLGFLLLVSLVVSTAAAALGDLLTGKLVGSQFLFQVLDFVISFGVITVLFAMIYKILPDVRIRWGDVWIGAAVTALLFTLGKILIGFYLAKSTVASAYGAAGSLVIILIWVYYSAQILFFGAELTHVYACKRGYVPAPKNADQTGELK
jgi:membrane protein